MWALNFCGVQDRDVRRAGAAAAAAPRRAQPTRQNLERNGFKFIGSGTYNDVYRYYDRDLKEHRVIKIEKTPQNSQLDTPGRSVQLFNEINNHVLNTYAPARVLTLEIPGFGPITTWDAPFINGPEADRQNRYEFALNSWLNTGRVTFDVNSRDNLRMDRKTKQPVLVDVGWALLFNTKENEEGQLVFSPISQIEKATVRATYATFFQRMVDCGDGEIAMLIKAQAALELHGQFSPRHYPPREKQIIRAILEHGTAIQSMDDGSEHSIPLLSILSSAWDNPRNLQLRGIITEVIELIKGRLENVQQRESESRATQPDIPHQSGSISTRPTTPAAAAAAAAAASRNYFDEAISGLEAIRRTKSSNRIIDSLFSERASHMRVIDEQIIAAKERISELKPDHQHSGSHAAKSQILQILDTLADAIQDDRLISYKSDGQQIKHSNTAGKIDELADKIHKHKS